MAYQSKPVKELRYLLLGQHARSNSTNLSFFFVFPDDLSSRLACSKLSLRTVTGRQPTLDVAASISRGDAGIFIRWGTSLNLN